jgi:hypothetical protein
MNEAAAANACENANVTRASLLRGIMVTSSEARTISVMMSRRTDALLRLWSEVVRRNRAGTSCYCPHPHARRCDTKRGLGVASVCER